MGTLIDIFINWSEHVMERVVLPWVAPVFMLSMSVVILFMALVSATWAFVRAGTWLWALGGVGFSAMLLFCGWMMLFMGMALCREAQGAR
jgi:hypothetical protein